MAYEKPKCECGSELNVYTQSLHGNITKIKKNGDFHLKSDSYYEKRDMNPRLKCADCPREYEIDFDDKCRVIRGDVHCMDDMEGQLIQ